MKCEDFDKLVHLYLDGELEEKKAKQVEEHLSTCKRCAVKLEELKNFVEAARKIRMPEPSPEYWKTFAERVGNEIILRRRKPMWARFKSGWESVFFYSPVKLRIAAGIASILLVFIIGRLYWEYKGREPERVKSEKMEKALSVPSQQKPQLPAPVARESLRAQAPSGETTLAESEPLVDKQKGVQTPAPSGPVSQVQLERKPDLAAQPESVASLKGGEAQGEREKVAGESKTQELKKSITVTAERPVIEKGVTANLKTITPQEVRAKTPSLPETTLYVQKLPIEKDAARMLAQKPVVPVQTGTELPPAEGIKYYKVDKNWVRVLAEKDTSIEADTLKKVISSWKEYNEKRSVPEWAPEGFSQIKIAHQLLFLKTKDQTILQEGIGLLNKYRESAADQKVRDELSKQISALEGLKKK